MSAFLIIFRIAQGKGWSHQTAMTAAQGFATQSIGKNGLSDVQFRTTKTTDEGIMPTGTRKESINLQVHQKARTLDFDQAVMTKSSAQDV